MNKIDAIIAIIKSNWSNKELVEYLDKISVERKKMYDENGKNIFKI